MLGRRTRPPALVAVSDVALEAVLPSSGFEGPNRLW
jgi:hypothetical protein